MRFDSFKNNDFEKLLVYKYCQPQTDHFVVSLAGIETRPTLC